MKGIRYKENHLSTAPHVKTLVTDWFLISYSAVHSHSNWCQLHFNKTLSDMRVHVNVGFKYVPSIIQTSHCSVNTRFSQFLLFRRTLSSSQQSVVFKWTKMKENKEDDRKKRRKVPLILFYTGLDSCSSPSFSPQSRSHLWLLCDVETPDAFSHRG